MHKSLIFLANKQKLCLARMIGTDIHARMGTMPHTVFSLYLGPPNYMSRDSPLTLMPTVPYASEEAVQPLSHMYCYQT